VSEEAKEKPDELELEERELQRDCSEMLERGEVERVGMENWVRIGVTQVGALISSASMMKIFSSSSLSSSRTFWAKVLRGAPTVGLNEPRDA